MIVRIKNFIHPTTRSVSGQALSSSLVTSTKQRSHRAKSVSPLLLQSYDIGSHGCYHCSKSQHRQLFSVSEEASLSLPSLETFHTEDICSDPDSAATTIHKLGLLRNQNFIEYADPMRIGRGGSSSSNRSYSSGFPSIAAKLSSSSLIAATTATCCWSVWILFLWTATYNQLYRSTSSNNLSRYPTALLPTAATAAIARSMSGYTTIFADAFHPSASYAAKDQEDEKGDETDSASKSENAHTDHALPEEATCHAEEPTEPQMGNPHPDDDRLLLFHFNSTTSTQDEAKAIAKDLSESSSNTNSPGTFCVTATSQSKGRGTTGRQWLGAPGNVFVTIGIPVDVYMTQLLRSRKIPLTLLPLKIGDLTAALVQSQLQACGIADATVTVKWPNDVLVDDKKISGTLIENASNWFLIGIGINVAHAPRVPTTGADYGRPSVSLDDYCGSEYDAELPTAGETARELGVKLALDVHRWVYDDGDDAATSSTAESIVDGWKRWLDWEAPLTMRKDGNKEGPARVVNLLDVLPDGRIKVANTGDGKEEILVSDYFV